VTKKEIVKGISDEMGLTQLKTKEIVQKTFDAIIETLVEERRIELRNFGVFEVKMRAARKARNPRTGGQVEVPAKFVVTFSRAKKWKKRSVSLKNEKPLADSRSREKKALRGAIPVKQLTGIQAMSGRKFVVRPLTVPLRFREIIREVLRNSRKRERSQQV